MVVSFLYKIVKKSTIDKFSIDFTSQIIDNLKSCDSYDEAYFNLKLVNCLV